MRNFEKLALAEIPVRFRELTGFEPVTDRSPDSAPDGPDLVLRAEQTLFLFEIKGLATSAAVSRAIEELLRIRRRVRKPTVPVVVVPYMGEVGRRLCERAEVSWMDLSGNARLFGPGLRVVVGGHPNRFKARGRRPNLFAPKSSRIARVLLLQWPARLTQRQLSRLTRLSEGHVSLVVRRLVEEGLVERDPDGTIGTSTPDLLLDAWHEAYDFDQHLVHRGYVMATSTDALLERIARACETQRLTYAATGLAAAWLLAPFALYRIVTVYIAGPLSSDTTRSLGFRSEPRGANTWIVTPNDDAVFDGTVLRHGIHCVSPVQTYLDLKGHPEQAADAAVHLRETLLNWTAHRTSGHDAAPA